MIDAVKFLAPCPVFPQPSNEISRMIFEKPSGYGGFRLVSHGIGIAIFVFVWALSMV